LWVEFELSGLDLRQVEHLVDEAKKVSTSAVHALQRLLRLRLYGRKTQISAGRANERLTVRHLERARDWPEFINVRNIRTK
jgi:ABC-type phosphate transport system auxiliary subunit